MRGRSLAAVLLLAVLLLAPVSRVSPVIAQSADDDLRDRAVAAATARELFQYAADRNFNALYDEIHPDAHAVVPRAAAVGAFEAIYTQVQAGGAQVLGVQLVRWTWPVTGQTYNRAAAIDFAQPYVDESGNEAWLADTMYLVQDDRGEWRWFFGSSPEFVQQAIEQFGGAPAAAPLTEGDLLQNVVDDLDAFYRDVVSYTPYTYQSPGVVVVGQGERAMSACGPAEGNFAGFYCPPDQTLYLDIPFIQQLQGQTPLAAAFVIAHEWAHHVQSGVGLIRVNPNQQPDEWNELYSIELELMADCMSGAWAQDAVTRGLLQVQDIQQAVDFALQFLGDPAYVGPYDAQAHGSGETRAQFIITGYQQGFLGCNVKL